MTTTTGTTTPTDTSSDAPPAYTGSQQSVQSPIGVPYYIIDPSTGQPALGPDGQPLRWGATVPVDVGTHGSMGTQGPGTAPSYVDPSTGQHSAYQLPRYFQGDEWLPAQLPPDAVASLQKKMVSAGLLKPNEAQLGIWDVASMNAYQRLLAYANASGLDKEIALDRWAQLHTGSPNSAGNQPLVVKLSNPDDLRQTFRKAVIDTLGEGWDQTKIDQMVNAYQQTETQAQTQNYQMTGSGSPTDPGGGGTLTAPPSPEAYAAAQAKTENPVGAQEHDALGFVGQFQNLVGQWSGG